MAAQPGRFNDGRTAAFRPVDVTAKPSGLEIRGQDGLLIAFWRIEDLHSDGELPGGKGVRVRCSADDGARLMLEQAEFVRHLLPRRPGFPWAKALGAVAATLALLAALWLGIPAGSRWLSNFVPPSMEQRWGDTLADGFEHQWGTCRQPAGEAALHLLSDRLAVYLPPEARPRRVVVVGIPDVNAIALPGNVVLVFKGLLADARNPDEVAGVLAHEFTHLRLRHPTAGMIRATGVGLAVTLVTGDASGLAATGAAMALAGAYSREDEAAADAGGASLMNAAGLDAHGLSSFFLRIAERPGQMPAWLATHPDSKARAEAVDKMAKPGGVPALTPEQWAALKGICG